MFQRTLAQLQTSVQVLGSYESSGDITSSVLLEYLNKAIVWSYDIITQCRDDFYCRTGTPFTVVAGQQVYALPTDFYNLRMLQIQYGQRWRKLEPTTVERIDNMSAYASSYTNVYRYVLSNQGLLLGPTPTNSTDVLRVKYIPLAPQLAIATDSVTFDRPQECDLVLTVAYRSCLQREDRSTSEVDGEIARLEQWLRANADSHDDAEPFFLSSRGPERHDGGGEWM